ncbi:MAG: hypothetical protein KC944_15280, partial [Candidatus Omnitrophica bacterium]|nr:hypothetical protein [Candidatus Omnitrophota bacterium]
MSGIYLLGGTKKQLRCFNGPLFRYGAYSPSRIFLYAFPKDIPGYNCGSLPKPTIQREYERMGGRFTLQGKQWVLKFDEESLRNFYLWDVLPHEIGHHVDRANFYTDNRRSERFAEWFAQEFFRCADLDEEFHIKIPP